MDLNKMTQKTQEALHQAQNTALRYGHQEVDGEHLLLALLEQPEGWLKLKPNCKDGPASQDRGPRREKSM
jgi:ATP-dependent Clp protease ATP-binding subunit ClpA